MNVITIIESIKNFFDFGIIIESMKNSMKHRFDMDIGEFFKYLFFGRGYYELTPPQLSKKMKEIENNILLVDLRERKQFEKNHIEGAISNPFDDFLTSVLVEQKYTDYLEKEMVLVCDTGHMSRVAGTVLAEEGFKILYSLKRGMRRWSKWQKLLSYCKNLKYEKNSLLASFCTSR